MGETLNNWSWTDWGTSPRKDSVYLLLAFLLHIPLIFVQFHAVSQVSLTNQERLENIDFVEEVARPAALPSPLPSPEQGLLSRVVHFFKLPSRAPEVKPREAAPEINRLQVQKAPEIAAKTEPAPKPLVGKSEFRDKLAPTPSPEEQALMPATSPAPISVASKTEVKMPASTLKDRAGFQISRSQLPSPVDEVKLNTRGAAGAGEPIQIPVGARPSAERLAEIPKSDRGSFRTGSVPSGGVGIPAPSGFSDVVRAPARLVTPAIPIDSARPSSGGNGTVGSMQGRTFTEKKPAQSVSAPVDTRGLQEVDRPAPQAPVSSSAPKRPSRSLFQITGPLANRQVLVQKVPVYPAWAQAKGIVASVALEFIVTPEGNVLADNILVKRTSGYPELDDLAVEALKQWKFAPLGLDSNQNQAGVIVFNYALQ